MKTIIYILSGAIMFSSIVSCSEKPPIQKKKSDQVTAEPVESKRSNTENTFNAQCSGVLEVAPNHLFAIHAPMNGVVRRISIRDGQQVKKGQTIAYLEHRDIIRLQEDFLKSKSEKEFLEKEFKRHQTLFAGKSISEREFESTKAAYLAAVASYESLLQQLKLLGISENQLLSKGISSSVPIRSEVNGVVRSVLVHEGSFVHQDSPIFELIDTEEKLVTLDVFPDNAMELKIGQKITFNVAGSDQKHETTIAFIGVSTDDQKNTVKVTSAPIQGKSSELIVGSRIFAAFE